MLLPLAWIMNNTALYLRAKHRAYLNEIPEKPVSTVSIIVCGHHEKDNVLEIALSSLRGQNVVKAYPELFELIFVGCEGINLDIVKKYADRIICAPKGKLTARDIGIKNAKGEIIVSADADSFFPPNSLNLLLKPFKCPEVIATTGTTDGNILEPIGYVFFRFVHYSSKIAGRFSAFRKWAYFKIGGFDLTKQKSVVDMIQEEEIGFKRKLEQYGKVVLVDTMVRHLESPLRRVGGIREYAKDYHSELSYV